jgi:hypothetical protein
MAKATWLADIEVYPNMFFLGIRDFKQRTEFSFEVSPRLDQREELFTAMSNFDGYFVTFNGVSYDQTVINYIIKDFKRLRHLPVAEFTRLVKSFSNAVIEDDFERIKFYKWFKIKYIPVDLYLYWAKSLRISKKISLKSLGIQLLHPEVQELPYEHTTILSYQEMEEITRYNLINDLGILEALFVEMKEQIGLRAFIEKEYGLSCWSMDAPKITSEILLKSYAKAINGDENEIRKQRWPDYNGLLGDLISDISFDFKHPTLRKIYEELLVSDRTFNIEQPFNHGETSMIISMGIGGIHSLVKNEIFEGYGDMIIKSSDVASLYPTLILVYLCFRQKEVNEKYGEVKKERLIAKKNKEKVKDTFLKLVLNSTSGILDNEYSWINYPEGALRMRILGQLMMLKSLDEVVARGFKALALNTDSIDVLIHKKDEKEYEEIIDTLGKQYDIVFEHETVKKTIYSNINNYIQIAEDGKVKRKGGTFKIDFDEKGNREIPLGDSVDELVIPKALNLYFVKGIPLEESITNPEKYGFTIFDYCKSNKVGKNYRVIHNGQQVQNLNRYYFSKGKPYLFKVKKGKTTYEHINVGEGVEIFNKYEKREWKDYEINYTHYVAKAREVVNEVTEKERQLKLF